MVAALCKVLALANGIPNPSPDIPSTVSTTVMLPNDTRARISDFSQIAERSERRLRFTRPGTEDFKNCTPGARYGFQTNATQIIITAASSNIVWRYDARNYLAVVLVDGVATYSFDTRNGGMTINFGSAVSRLVEIVWPYADAMDLLKIEINSGAAFTAPAARPTGVIACAGDSITQGFTGSHVATTWAYKLAALKGRQLINFGDGGDVATASYANALIGCGADLVTYLIGYNNFAAQTPLATFKAEVKGWINNARAALPAAKIYVISPLYSPNSGPLTLANYRAQVQAGVSEIGGANLYYIDGTTIMGNSNDRLVDTVHPNDTGSTEISNSLNATLAA